jgi:hypothetical protein
VPTINLNPIQPHQRMAILFYNPNQLTDEAIKAASDKKSPLY